MDGYALVHKARTWAYAGHAGQRYGHKPYTHHLGQSVLVLIEFGLDTPEREAAQWLHDYLEDVKGATPGGLRQEFPHGVCYIVEGVTDEPGETRVERKRRTYAKIAGCTNRTICKLCDRIANLREAWITLNTEKRLMYVREDAEFTASLYLADPVLEPLWAAYRILIRP